MSEVELTDNQCVKLDKAHSMLGKSVKARKNNIKFNLVVRKVEHELLGEKGVLRIIYTCDLYDAKGKLVLLDQKFSANAVEKGEL